MPRRTINDRAARDGVRLAGSGIVLPPAPAISERQFSQQVVDAATLLGWRCYRTWTSIHSPAGFPDLVLVRRPWILFWELKRDGEEPTAEQQAWLDELAACGLEARWYCPSDWPEIERRLGSP